MKKAIETAYTDKQASVYDESRFTSNAGTAIHKIELSKVIGILSRLSKSARVVEVGCGTGRLLMECVKRGYTVDGVDASPEMLKELRNKLDEKNIRVELTEVEAANMPYENGTYDFAYSVRLLNQTESPAYALRIVNEMVRIVKPGGYALIECVNEKRPRVGRNRGAATRLKADDIIEAGAKAGATLEWVEGAFFLGMGSYPKLGNAGVPIISLGDRVLSGIFPQACARIYVLLKKREERDAG